MITYRQLDQSDLCKYQFEALDIMLSQSALLVQATLETWSQHVAFFANFVHLYIHLKTAHVHVACCTCKHRLKHIGIIILHDNGTWWYTLQLEKKYLCSKIFKFRCSVTNYNNNSWQQWSWRLIRSVKWYLVEIQKLVHLANSWPLLTCYWPLPVYVLVFWQEIQNR